MAKNTKPELKAKPDPSVHVYPDAPTPSVPAGIDMISVPREDYEGLLQDRADAIAIAKAAEERAAVAESKIDALEAALAAAEEKAIAATDVLALPEIALAVHDAVRDGGLIARPWSGTPRLLRCDPAGKELASVHSEGKNRAQVEVYGAKALGIRIPAPLPLDEAKAWADSVLAARGIEAL